MLQEHHQMIDGIMARQGKVGIGMSIYFICEKALKIYNELIDKSIDASKPFMGTNTWVTSLDDPDGYRIFFESVTDVAEGTTFSE